MSEQQDNPKRSIVAPVLIALVAVAIFGYAFYALDGLSLIDDLFGTSFTNEAAERSEPGIGQEQAEFDLPEAMSAEFALRIWQEQLDSQANIRRLMFGEIDRIEVTDIEQGSEVATLSITAYFTDGTSAPGHLGMRKFGQDWYFAYVTGMRPEDTGGFADDTNVGVGDPPEGELPDIEDVDVPLLNTILAQQTASAAVLEEYATGVVQSVRVEDVVENPGTRTLDLVMNEDHEQGKGTLVAISKEIDGEELWFIAKFAKESAE